jgi:DNA-binding transcriptional LysR family regulator
MRNPSRGDYPGKPRRRRRRTSQNSRRPKALCDRRMRQKAQRCPEGTRVRALRTTRLPIFHDVQRSNGRAAGKTAHAAAKPAMINLRQIEVFYAVMRAGSVTEAARILNVTQPAVSVALKQLESRLKMTLFDRSGGRLQPTPEAKALLPDVAEIFGRLGAVERFSQDLAGGARGVLSIAATPPLCDGFVAKAVATFVAKRPGVKVNLQALASPIILDRVINREVDMGVVYEPVVSSAVTTEEVMRAAIGCIMPARHALAKRATIRVRDLAPYPVVTYLPQALLRPYIDRVLSEKASPITVSVETGT